MLKLEGLKLAPEEKEAALHRRAARLLHIPEEDVLSVQVLRRSIDAREELHLVYTVAAEVRQEKQVLRRCRDRRVSRFAPERYALPEVLSSPEVPPVVVGAGPGGLFAALVLLPLFWLGVSAFKSDADVIKWPPIFFPTEWVTTQFAYVWKVLPIARMLLNTVVFAGGVTIISLFFDSMAAYAFARMKFTGRKLLFGIILLTMMIPFQVVMIPLYMEEYKLGILNTFLGLILPRAASAYGIFMLTSFFSGIPKSLDEAAKIDGMGEWKIYLKIILPLAKPALVTLGIYHFMNNWNDLLYPMMLTSSVEMRTLSAGLAILVGSNSIKYGPTLAATVIAILPLLLLFLFGQKFFMEGIATSGMKE